MRYSVSVEQRGPVWYARVYVEGEEGASRRFSTGVRVGEDKHESERLAQAAANERAEKLVEQLGLGVIERHQNEHALEQVAKRMLAQKRVDGRRKRAIDALAFNLDKHVLPHFGKSRDVRLIKRRDLESFKIGLAAKYEPTTVNNILTAIRQSLEYACQIDESIESVPVVKNLAVPKRGTGMPITTEQAQVFLRSFEDDEAREFNLFLLNTGLRKTESLAIRWEWIDWDERVIRIPGEVRKGGKEQRTPTEITAEVYKLLRARQKREKQPSKGRVWFQLKGGRKGSRSYDGARLAAAAKAGIAGYRHHDARHSRATWLAEGGASEMDIRDAMNWETSAMANRYTHPSRDRVRRLAATIQVPNPSHPKPSHQRKK